MAGDFRGDSGIVGFPGGVTDREFDALADEPVPRTGGEAVNIELASRVGGRRHALSTMSSWT